MHARGMLGVALAAALFVVSLVAPETAQAATYPSWDEIQRSMQNEQAKQQEISRVQDSLNALHAQYEQATEALSQRQSEFQAAQQKLQQQEDATNEIRVRALSAAQRAATLKSQAGRAVAQLSRSAGTDLGNAVLGTQDASRTLYRLGAVSRISESTRNLASQATSEAKSAKALSGQATTAEAEYRRLATEAQQKAAAAQQAEKDVQAALDAQTANESTLETQLATLKGETEQLKTQRAAGIAKEQAERAAAAAKAAAALAATRAQAVNGNLSTQTPAVSSGAVGYPLAVAQVTSRYGMRLHPILNVMRMHYGTDFGAAYGTSILAIANGTVSGVEGSTLTVRHVVSGQTVYARYLHLSAITVRVGQTVSRGQSIGRVGNAGLSTGPHLHFEIHVGSVSYGGGVYGSSPGNTVDPIAWLRSH